MIKETIEYTDYNGTDRKEDYYFNLTEAELMEMEMSTNGGMTGLINNIIAAQDAPAIIAIFKDLLLKSYGQKSLDGKRFIKNQALRDEFEQSPAYSQLFMQLATDADAASKFVNGIIPSDAASIKAEKNQTVSNKIETLPVE